MTNEHGVARSTGQHADHDQPDIGYALWWIPAVANTQHVRQRLEQRPRVLLVPVSTLHYNNNTFVNKNDNTNNVAADNDDDDDDDPEDSFLFQ